MGKSLTKFLWRFTGPRYVRVLMLGLDGVGKTTLLYKLKFGESVTTIPTVGYNVETVLYSKIRLTIWECAGQEKVRPVWRHYFQGTQVLIIVVDCTDRERIDELREEMKRLMDEDELRGVPVLLFANKQDLPNAMSPSEVEQLLELPTMLRNHDWYVQSSCAISGDGLYEGLWWIKQVTKHAK